MLGEARIVGFIPTKDAERARPFFEATLGLEMVADEAFALVFRIPGGTLRLVRVEELTPGPGTIFGWEVDDLRETAKELARRGVAAVRYGFLEQDADGIWTTPSGAKVLWFMDPDGNTLSVTEYSRG